MKPNNRQIREDSNIVSFNLKLYVLFLVKDMSTGRQEAFEIFKRDYADNNIIDEQKLFLKKGYAEAKTLGEKINLSRNKINTLKTKIEQVHMRLAATDSLNDVKQNEELEDLKQNMENEKSMCVIYILI
jgi:kinesin family protein 6/9